MGRVMNLSVAVAKPNDADLTSDCAIAWRLSDVKLRETDFVIGKLSVFSWLGVNDKVADIIFEMSVD